MAFLSREKIEEIGFKSVGENVLISNKASIYNSKKIELGDNIRIDDFCIISAGEDGIKIGNYVHIACFCSLIGNGKITLSDFSGLSSRVSIYSSNDDYSGEYLTNPCVPKELTNVTSAPVTLEKHVIIGAGSIILPDVIVGYGTAVGSLSLVTKSCKELSVYFGSPAKRINKRKNDFQILEKKFLK